jgi:hypothetical protein
LDQWGLSSFATRLSSPVYHREAEVTRLTRDLNQAREEQTATAERLQIISNFSGGLEAVFDAMLEKAVRIFRATR